MSPLRRRVTASVLAATAALTMGACGTNFSAQTNQQYQAAEGANSRGEVDVMNTVLVADEDGAGVVSAGVVNQTDDPQTITAVTITTGDGQSLTVEAPKTPVEVPAGDIVTLGQTGGDALYVVPEGAEAGDYVTISLTFSDAPATEVDAPTVARSETYAEVAPAS